MQGPVVDVVLMLLLILFFGIQQRTRPQIRFRFWFVGWILVFLGYAVWAVEGVPPRLVPLQNAICFDFMLLGTLTFLMSLLATEQRLRKMMQVGVATIGIVNVLIIDAQQFVTVPKAVLVLAILLCQGDGFYIAYRLLPREWARTRWLILANCVLYGIVLLGYVLFTSGKNLDNWAIVEVLLCAAVMYAGSTGGKGVAGCVGTVGFAAWAAFYLASMLLTDSPSAQKFLDEFWNFPKYFVGFSMILKVFEDTAAEKERIADEFRELYEEFRSVFLSHPYPMLVYETRTEKFLGANAAAMSAYGYTEAELLGMSLKDLEDREEVETEHVLPEEEEGRYARYRLKNGKIAWVHVTDRSILFRGKHSRFVIARDVTERLKLDKELSHRAQHDVLTGLPNRQLLDDRLEDCLNTSEREQRKAAILTIDVDHFKLINDTYGHLIGDECLQAVAARLKSKIRKVDTIARTGGEEFMAVVSGLNSVTDAEKVAASLLRVFEEPLDLSIGLVGVTASIGVSVYPDDGKDAETLRRLSDEALYRAKRSGRNRAAYAFDVREEQWAI